MLQVQTLDIQNLNLWTEWITIIIGYFDGKFEFLLNFSFSEKATNI